LNSALLCENLSKEGFHAYDKTCALNKLSTPTEINALMAPTQAQPIGENLWFRRYGMGKNYAPRISPVSWWVYIAEDQRIQFDVSSGELTVALDAVCVELGEHIRTIRLFRAKEVSPSTVEVTMQFGAVNARTGLVDKEAAALREQAFSEILEPTWKWATRAEEILKK